MRFIFMLDAFLLGLKLKWKHKWPTNWSKIARFGTQLDMALPLLLKCKCSVKCDVSNAFFVSQAEGRELKCKFVLEFSPLGFCAILMKSKFFLGIPGFCQHLHFCFFWRCCVWWVLGGSRCLSCWTEDGLGQSPSTEQTGSSFPHILPREIIPIVPYSLCMFSLSNEWHSGCFQNFYCFI